MMKGILSLIVFLSLCCLANSFEFDESTLKFRFNEKNLLHDFINSYKGSDLLKVRNTPEDYTDIADLLIRVARQATNTSKLEYVCDTFGPRFCGTSNLERAIDWILQTMQEEGLENVHYENVPNIIHWVRGKESLSLLLPRVHQMALLGLGNSVGTNSSGILAEVFVVSSFDELNQNADKANGKIVVFNAPFVSYGETVAYRVDGASAAAKVGAVAALVRSITPYSLYTPHTGGMRYESGVPQIPTAAITVEDAEMMARMQARGQKMMAKLYMEAQTKDPITSRNIIAEVVGRENPEQIVAFGGHIDSWDVGQGAMDDGGGIFSAWEAITHISQLVSNNIIPRPRRTIRLIGWVNEELGARGAAQYVQDHQNELNNHILAVESDIGNFGPTGFGFTGSDQANQIMQNISLFLLDQIGAGNLDIGNGADTDNGFLVQKGVPGASLESLGMSGTGDNAFYFNYHHSNADTITALNYDGLRLSVASMAILSYVVADLEQSLRDPVTSEVSN